MKVSWNDRFLPTFHTRLCQSGKPPYLKEEVEETFVLDEAALEAHELLKISVTSAPILALPRSVGQYRI